MEAFEKANKISLVVFDKNFKDFYITKDTRNNLKSDNIRYIGRKIKETYPNEKVEGNLFRVYNKYNLPTKYTAYVMPYYITNEPKYIAIVIPEVFTTKSSKAVKDYIVYIFIVLIILIIFVSAAASYVVAKPVIKINKTAAKIAALDFTEKCEINNDDEIGNLAKTINYLSDNLKSNLERLQKDLDLQKELDHLRKEFIAAITHEFKTPITLIKGYTESIIDNVAEGEEREDALNTIIGETENMDKLVRDLLDLSKLEAVGYKLNISVFCIDELLEKISKKYEKVITERNIRLVKNFERHNILVSGDFFRIEQVISNFINNAAENTPAEKAITISLKEKSGAVIISVHNQGKNIEESELDRIWEKFYRIEKSRNKKLGGTGLGLSISKSILDLHKSDYGVRNTNEGVEFFFSLGYNTKFN
jgi:signal transduction histidine kinase